MESKVYQKTPFGRLMLASVLGIGTATAATVLLNFGLIQFNIIRLVGQQQVTSVFGTVAGFGGLAILILTPLGGAIADKTNVKFGRRRTWIIIGSVGGALSMLAFAYSPSIPILAIGWILTKFFYGMVALSCFAIVPEQVDKERFGRVSGIFSAAAPLFVMGGSIVLGIFASAAVQDKLLGIIAIQLICGLLAAALIKDNYFEKEKTVEKKKNFLEDLKNFYPSPRKYPNFTWGLLTKLFINVTNAGLSLLTLFYIARFHMDQTAIFQLNAYQSPSIMLMVFSGLLGGFLSDKIKKQKPFVFGAALITGLCMVTFAFSQNITWVIIGNFVFNFGFGMYGAVDNALINRIITSKENAGKEMGLMTVTSNFTQAMVNFAAPFFVSLGVSLFGGDGYTFYFIVLAGFSVLSALVVLPIPELGQSEKEEEAIEQVN